MNYYLMAFQKYADFNGRSRRSEYWYFTLFNVLAAIGCMVLDSVIFGSEGFGVLYGIYALGSLIPGLAVAVRRLHDIGKSGWNLLWGLIPLIGAIVLIVWYVTDSEPGTNAYGPNPKGIGDDALIDEIGNN